MLLKCLETDCVSPPPARPAESASLRLIWTLETRDYASSIDCSVVVDALTMAEGCQKRLTIEQDAHDIFYCYRGVRVKNGRR